MTSPIPYYRVDPDGAAIALYGKQLRLLSIFHYILAGLTALYGCVAVYYLVIDLSNFGRPIAPDVRVLFPPLVELMIVGVFTQAIWILAILIFFAGRCLARRHRHAFCAVVACLECLFIPLGTILGALTLSVLWRPNVKVIFGLPALVRRRRWYPPYQLML
ncbi:MAG: hypothetical protein WCI73_11085 [Phycisphaerae bacterium]